MVRRGGYVPLELLDVVERHVETEPRSLEYAEAEIWIGVIADVGDPYCSVVTYKICRMLRILALSVDLVIQEEPVRR